MTGIKGMILAAAAVATVGGPASAACWTNSAVEAAYVRDFDTILMVATLRCRTKGVEMATDYNRFVREKRTVLVAANDELRAQFAAGRTQKAALDAFDRYATSLANTHGAGSDTLSCADYKELVAQAVAAPASRVALLQLAAKAEANPAIPSEGCTRQVALAR
jgi:hypothetical protein